MMLAAVVLASTLTFPDALERALQNRGAHAFYEERAQTLESFSFRRQASVRAETGFATAKDLNLITRSIDRFDAFTALVALDYPILDGGDVLRRASDARLHADRLRERSRDEEEQLFDETLDAFAQLYLVDQQIASLAESAKRAKDVRERSQTMLEVGSISNLTAAFWIDQSLGTETRALDLELQRIDAETRLEQLIGETSNEKISVTLESADAGGGQRAAGRLSRPLPAARRPLALNLSAFAGVAAMPHENDGTFGLYGIRFTLSLPMLDAATRHRAAMERIAADEEERARQLAETARQQRRERLRQSIEAADRKIVLLEEAVTVARMREQSLERLVRAGTRTDADLLDAAGARSRRESDLLAARVERWKLQQRANRIR